MSSTTQVTTFSDIYTEILNKMRQPTGVTAITEQAKRYANTALHDMVFGFEYKLPWLERDAVLRTRAPYTTGTVDATVGSATLTGSSTVWTTTDAYGLANARAGGKITLGDSNIYTVTTVGGAGSITLREQFVGPDDISAGDYTYFEDTFTLASDFLKPVDYRIFTSAMNVPLIGRNEFKQRFPRPNIGGKPRVATIIDRPFSGSTAPVICVQFYPYPNAVYLLPYSYITSNLAVSSAGVEQAGMSSDSDEPNLPLHYRHGIVLHAISAWYRDKKDDARATLAIQDYNNVIDRIVNDQRIGTNAKAQLQPRVGMYAGYARSPYGGGSRGRRFSTNNSFDEFRD